MFDIDDNICSYFHNQNLRSAPDPFEKSDNRPKRQDMNGLRRARRRMLSQIQIRHGRLTQPNIIVPIFIIVAQVPVSSLCRLSYFSPSTHEQPISQPPLRVPAIVDQNSISFPTTGSMRWTSSTPYCVTRVMIFLTVLHALSARLCLCSPWIIS
ncbi:hypothetical protein JOM56_015326 [Amanita muscaria]